MSIWSSIEGPDILALNGHRDDANYTAQGTPALVVDVATTTWLHDYHIRLAVWDAPASWANDEIVHVCAVLSPEAALLLRDRLDAAIARVSAP